MLRITGIIAVLALPVLASGPAMAKNWVRVNRVVEDIKPTTLTYGKTDTAASGKLFWASAAYSGSWKMKINATIFCTDSGYRVWGYGGGVVYGATPRNYTRRSTHMTGSFLPPVSFANKSAALKSCNVALWQYFMRYPNGSYPKPFKHVMYADVRAKLTGECIRVKFPWKGRRDKFQTYHVRKRVKFTCRANPVSVAKLERHYLYNYWHKGRTDNAQSGEGTKYLLGKGYGSRTKVATVFVRPSKGRIAIYLLRSKVTGDHMVTTTRTYPGYSYRANLGYIFKRRAGMTIPLKLYYSPARKDYMALATYRSERSARKHGYKLVKTLGYVYPAHWRFMPVR